MRPILFNPPLSSQHVSQLAKEFSEFFFLAPAQQVFTSLGKEGWGEVEIFYGSQLSLESLENAKKLRWIHSPSPELDLLPLKEIYARENILLTRAHKENFVQAGEYVTGGILLFAKRFPNWFQTPPLPQTLPKEEKIWSLKEKLLIQLGLGQVGTEVTKRAKQLGMRVFGVGQKRSFHPNCEKTFSYGELHSILPSADVLSVAFPWEDRGHKRLGEQDFSLIQEGSVVIVLDAQRNVQLDELTHVTRKKHLRGLLIDDTEPSSIPTDSPLWKQPNCIITPSVAPEPREKDFSLRLFRYNLRQYLHRNYSHMRNQVSSPIR